jgi:putative membrane protein
MITLLLSLPAWIYRRGWSRLHRTSPGIFSIGKFVAFAGGLLCIWIAIASPLADYDDELLSVHMIQHLLLMTAAPALILLGSPALPFLRGLPRRFVHSIASPALRATSALTHPAICWLAAAAAVIGWHIPVVFESARHSIFWHVMQHASFLGAGLLFWWPIIQPWPSISTLPRWSAPLYLFSATLPCDALSAFLVFCGRVIYPSSHSLEDQECAGALMWVTITFVYLIPAIVIMIRTIDARHAEAT